jgi:two-component system, sensor histidine kinase LadS
MLTFVAMLKRFRSKLVHACLLVGLLLGGWALTSLKAQSTATAPVGDVLLPKPPFLPQQSQLPTIRLQANTRSIDINEQSTYWIDPSSDTTPSQVLARATSGAELFQANSSRKSLAVHQKVLWLRFETLSEVPEARWLLEIGSPLVDDVQLFGRDAQGRWQVQKSGDVVPRVEWPMHTRMPTFYLAQETGKPTEYLLRVVHQRAPVSLPLKIWQDSAFVASQQTLMLMLGVFFGLVLLVLLASLAMATVMRDAAFLAYSGYLLTLGGFMFTNVGLSATYLWPQSPILADRAVFVLACLTAAAGPWFVRTILQPVTRRRSIDSAIAITIVVMLTMALLEAWVPSMFSYLLINTSTVFALLLIYAMVFASWQRDDKATRWVAVGFIPVVLGVVPLLARNLALIPNSDVTQYSVLVGSALEMPILLYALLLRSARRRDNIMRATGLPTQDALTRLPNLRLLLEQLHGVISRANRYRHRYGLILVELTNEAWFAKEHTRETADRALILLAARLQHLSREVDLVSRIDATHFAMVIEGPCSARSMANLATRIAACGHKPYEVLPVGAILKLKITCALLPLSASADAADDANAQLGWLIAQADALPTDSRKTIHTLGF